jgi:hypothetical protein
MSPNLIQQICHNVERVVAKNTPNLPAWPTNMPSEAVAAAYNILLPQSSEDEINKLVPHGSLPFIRDFSYCVVKPNAKVEDARYNTMNTLYAALPKHRIQMSGRRVIMSEPGFEFILWDRGAFWVQPKGDGSDIQDPHLKAYVQTTVDTYNAHEAYSKECSAAVEKMSTFLRQYSTLNNAVKDFGPALFEYVPAHIKDLYNKEPVPRKQRVKREKVEIDVSDLIVKAFENKVELNA